jgi:hypothetical protein
MRHVRSIFIVLAAVIALPLAAAVKNNQAGYVGGTLSIPQGALGVIDASNGEALQFTRGDDSYSIPYSGITSIEWSDKVGRRSESVSARTVMAAPINMFKKKPQYLTVAFHEGQVNQVAIFELMEDTLRPLVPALEARTGKKVEVTDSFAPAPVVPPAAPVAAAAPVMAPAPAQGSMVDVSFISKPAGAAVLFYGMPAGRTPMVTKLAPGEYKVTVSAAGMQDWVQQFSVEPAKPVSLVAELKPRLQEKVVENGNQIMLPAPTVVAPAPAAAPSKKPVRRKKVTPANEASAELPKIIVGNAK